MVYHITERVWPEPHAESELLIMLPLTARPLIILPSTIVSLSILLSLSALLIHSRWGGLQLQDRRRCRSSSGGICSSRRGVPSGGIDRGRSRSVRCGNTHRSRREIGRA